MPPTNRTAYRKHTWSGGKRKNKQIAAGLRRHHSGETSRAVVWRKNENRSQKKLIRQYNYERGKAQHTPCGQDNEENLSSSCTGDDGFDSSILTMVRLEEDRSSRLHNDTVRRFTWHSESGVSVTVMSYGAIVQSIKVPDKSGEIADIVLGFDDVESYATRNAPYLGAALGRCANRIGGASFQIDGVTHKLTSNVGNNQLHGGLVGFDKVNWTTTVDGNKVIFSYLSKDGEEGYPGDLLVTVSYELADDDRFLVDFMATTTKKTVVNLSNHSYFNLAGHDAGAEELFNHVAAVFADKITETDADSIPTGRLLPVGGTPFDLRTPRRLGDLISKNDRLFDDNFCVTTFGKQDLHYVSRVVHPPSGRYLEVYSDQPGVQLYTSYYLPAPSEPALIGKGGVGYRRHGAFCLETQKYPDAVHHENFPTPILKPGDIYRHKIAYGFGAEHSDDPLVITL